MNKYILVATVLSMLSLFEAQASELSEIVQRPNSEVARLEILIPQVCVIDNEIVEVPILANGFIEISNFTLAFEIDTSILQLVKVQEDSLANVIVNFGCPTSIRPYVQWQTDFMNRYFTFPDSSVLFTLTFQIDPLIIDTIATIGFIDPTPCEIEFNDARGMQVPFNLTEGSVMVKAPEVIPTIQEWGIIILFLLISIIASIQFKTNNQNSYRRLLQIKK